MSFKFGLGGPKKGLKPQLKKPAGKPVSAFGADDEDEDSGFPENSSKDAKKAKAKFSQFGDLSTQQTYRKNADKALEVDASIYDYDGAWEAIKAREEAKKTADREAAEEGKAKYMDNLIASREVREKDYLNAKEKKYQRDREAEGDEFVEKEKFVTGAYKKQQEQTRIQEELEKKREEAERKRREKDGKNVFLNKLLEQGNRQHMDAVEAAAKGIDPKLKPTSAEDMKKTEADLAKELNARGADIAFTDDGEVADKRQLLTAGLNVMAKPKAKVLQNRALPLGTSSSQSSKLGNLRGAARERQSRMVEDQMEQLLKRQADDDAEEQRKTEHASKSRKTTGDVSSAKERYLQRKKAQEEAAATVSAASNGTTK